MLIRLSYINRNRRTNRCNPLIQKTLVQEVAMYQLACPTMSDTACDARGSRALYHRLDSLRFGAGAAVNPGFTIGTVGS